MSLIDVTEFIKESKFTDIMILIVLAIIMYVLPKIIKSFYERESRLFSKIDKINTLSQSIAQNKDQIINKILKMKLYSKVSKFVYLDFGINIRTNKKLEQVGRLYNTDINLYDIKKLIRLGLIKIFTNKIEFYSLNRIKSKNCKTMVIVILSWILCTVFLFTGLLICFETKKTFVGVYSVVIGFLFEIIALVSHADNFLSKTKYKEIFRDICKIEGVIFKK